MINGYQPNESEQAKAELMHFGVSGMKWGIRKAVQKADARSAIKSGVNPFHPKAKKLNALRDKVKSGEWKRFDKMGADIKKMDQKMDVFKNKKMSEIDKGEGSFLGKALKRYKLNAKIEDARAVKLGKREEQWEKGEKGRNARVKAKQDKAATRITEEARAAIKAASKRGNIFERIRNTQKLDLEYTMKLQEEMFRIDAEEK